MKTAIAATFGLWLLAGAAMSASAQEGGAAPASGEDAQVRIDHALAGLASADTFESAHALVTLRELPPEEIPVLEHALGREGLAPAAMETATAAAAIARAESELPGYRESWTPRVEWYERALLGAYDAGGRRDPRWDSAAREALLLSARAWGKPTRAYDDRVLAACARAVAAGCDDPIVRYTSLRFRGMIGLVVGGEAALQYRALAEALAGGPYDTAFAAGSWSMAGLKGMEVWPREGPSPDARRWVQECLDAAIPLLARAGSPVAGRLSTATRLTQIGRALDAGRDRRPSYERVAAALRAAGWPVPVLQSFEGQFLVDYAWDARGSGWARDVEDDGWRLFSERLAGSRRALEASWTADATCAATACTMITVCMGEGDDDGVKAWFRRAVVADPYSIEACSNALNALEPKWGGTPEELIAFARWRGQSGCVYELAYLPAMAHERIGYALSGYETANHAVLERYMAQPSVWEEIREIHERYLRLYPEDSYARCFYARWACDASQWSVAKEQFDRIVNPHPHVFGGTRRFQELREKAARGAAPAPEQAPPR